MRSLKPLILLAAFAIGVAEASFFYNYNYNDGPTTGQQFAGDIQTAAHNLQESVILKKKAIAGAIGAVGKAKLGVAKGTGEATVHAVSSVLRAKQAKLEAIKAAKRAFLNTLTGKFTSSVDTSINNVTPQTEDSPSLQRTHRRPLLDLLRRTLAQLGRFTRTKAAAKDYIKIGDTEYVFVPAQGSMANEEEHNPQEEGFSEYANEKEPVSHSSTQQPLPALPPAPTLPPITYNSAARRISVTQGR